MNSTIQQLEHELSQAVVRAKKCADQVNAAKELLQVAGQELLAADKDLHAATERYEAALVEQAIPPLKEAQAEARRALEAARAVTAPE